MDFFPQRRKVREQLSSDSESGIASISMISDWYGGRVDMQTMRRKFPNCVGDRLTPKDLLRPAQALGLNPRLSDCSITELQGIQMPCIAWHGFNKFVIIESATAGRISYIDNIHGRLRSKINAFDTYYSGVVMELSPTPLFQKKRYERAPKLLELLYFSQQAKSLITQSVLLSIFLQILTLLTPFYMQLVIDNVIAANDKNLLVLLAFSFALIAIFNAIGTAIRGLLLQTLSGAVARDVSFKLHHHLHRLPLQFFQTRSIGDIFQRFRGIEMVRFYLNGAFVGAFVDGLLATVTCVLMFLYSPLLASTVIIFVFAYLASRLKTNSACRSLFKDFLQTDSKEAGYFIETLNSVQTIRVLNVLPKREAAWQKRYLERLAAANRWGNADIAFNGLNLLISSLSDVVLLYLAAKLTIEGSITIGVMAAFLAYKVQFMARIINIIDQFSQFKRIEGLADRIGEIAQNEPELSPGNAAAQHFELKGKVEFRNIKFRHSSDERLILDGANLTIHQGEFVTIVGSSGSGKSTMLKLLLGLYQPVSGELIFDDVPLSSLEISCVRDCIGSVMTEDVIFNGSVTDNICMFDENYCFEWTQQCARFASIDSAIMALPKGYETLLGTSTFVLSAGQRQRLLIARALYRRPKLLILDEGTANLDPDTEREIVARLRSMNMTCLAVAHSSTVAAASDRVYELSMGRLILRTDAPSDSISPSAS